MLFRSPHVRGTQADVTAVWLARALLPLAVRSGAATPEILAWIRAGAQPRVTAHILSSITALPEALDDDELQRQAYRQLRELTEGAAAGIAEPQHQPVLRALGIVRDAR